VIRWLVSLNPLTGILEGTRWVVLSDYAPSAGPILLAAVTSLLVVVAGWRLFARLETTMADDI
jgi:ABC-type polysaccharide/polyol phosphate export permease